MLEDMLERKSMFVLNLAFSRLFFINLRSCCTLSF